MPQRFLRPGITTSASWNAITWQAQSFYIRLLTLVDDFGRYDGRWQVLRSHAFPLTEAINEPQMRALCEELHATGLAVFYRASDGKEYVQVTKWKEKARSEARFPSFDDSCEQMFSIASNCSSPSPSPSPSPSVDANKCLQADDGEEPRPVKLTEEQAIAQANGPAGVPEDFARYIYGDWSSRGGRDAGNVAVKWLPYVKKRWAREQDEWRNGIHKCQKKPTKNPNPQNYVNL